MKKLMSPALLTVSFAILLMFSCNKNETPDNTCGVSNPLEDLPWLKNRIAQLGANQQSARYQFVSTAEYRKKTVFIFGNCDPLAISDFTVINCTNVTLGTVGDIPPDSLLNRKTIWKTQDSLCNVE